MKKTEVNLTDTVLLLGGFLETMTEVQRKAAVQLLHNVLENPSERFEWAPLIGGIIQPQQQHSVMQQVIDRAMKPRDNSMSENVAG